MYILYYIYIYSAVFWAQLGWETQPTAVVFLMNVFLGYVSI